MFDKGFFPRELILACRSMKESRRRTVNTRDE